jgi:hypothetical protein
VVADDTEWSGKARAVTVAPAIGAEGSEYVEFAIMLFDSVVGVAYRYSIGGAPPLSMSTTSFVS